MKIFVFFLIFVFIVFSCRNKENIAQNNSENINKSTAIEEEFIAKNTEINNLTSKIINPFSIEELNALPSLWQIKTKDSKYLIEDRGTAPPPRFVVVKDLENGEIIFFGTYFQNINLREYTIEIVKNYGTYYAGKWSINENLVDNEIDFGKIFLKENEPPLEWVETADLAKGNGFGLLIIFEYNFKTKENKIIGGKYYTTM